MIKEENGRDILISLHCFREPQADDHEYEIIREIFENENASEYFENQLDQALETKYRVIIIEPSKLGDETARWITVGNCLHKTAVLSGLVCLASGGVWPDHRLMYLPLGFTSLVCAGVYTMSWQFDPCCKYQVEYDATQLERLPLHSLTSSSPVVLVRKDDFYRKLLHSSVALAASTYCGYRLYQWYFE